MVVLGLVEEAAHSDDFCLKLLEFVYKENILNYLEMAGLARGAIVLLTISLAVVAVSPGRRLLFLYLSKLDPRAGVEFCASGALVVVVVLALGLLLPPNGFSASGEVS